MPQQIKLNTKPTLFRFSRAALAAEPAKTNFDSEGGMYGAGVLQNVCVITEGEALGHSLWIDSQTIRETNDAIVASGEQGVKSRFTHPSLSSDGLGKHLGRIVNPRIEGKSLYGDLHFTKSAHNTPDGDLAEYVQLLVSEDPKAAGLSIVFDRDYQSESVFMIEHGAKISQGEYGSQYVDTSAFKSPDPANIENYPHARLANLYAVDVVDDPACNPDGMFDSNPVARDADKALACVFGLEKMSEQGEYSVCGIDIERATQFVARFFSARGLAIVKEQSPPKPQEFTREQLTSELSKYTSRFGAENGVKWFTDGKNFEQALELHSQSLQSANKQLLEQVESLSQRLRAVEIGTDPLPVSGMQEAKKTLSSLMKPVQ